MNKYTVRIKKKAGVLFVICEYTDLYNIYFKQIQNHQIIIVKYWHILLQISIPISNCFVQYLIAVNILILRDVQEMPMLKM